MINALRNVGTIFSLSFGEALYGGFLITIIGMSVTFLCLSFLWLMIAFQSKMLNAKLDKSQIVQDVLKSDENHVLNTSIDNDRADKSELDDLELMAAISAALHNYLGDKVAFKVLNIVNMSDDRTQWCKQGLSEFVSRN